MAAVESSIDALSVASLLKIQRGDLGHGKIKRKEDTDMAISDLFPRKAVGSKTRSQPWERNIIAYRIIRSFKPGEITPEEANRLGYELAMKSNGGENPWSSARRSRRISPGLSVWGGLCGDCFKRADWQSPYRDEGKHKTSGGAKNVNLLVDFQAKMQAGKGKKL